MKSMAEDVVRLLIIEDSQDDADLLESAIQEIDGIDFASEAWPVALQRLITAVKQHAEEEEKERKT